MYLTKAMWVLVTLLAVALGGLIGSATLPGWLAAAGGAAAAAWFLHHTPRHLLYMQVNLEPDAPDATILQQALLQAIKRLRQTTPGILLRISAPSNHTDQVLRLELDSELDLTIKGAGYPTLHLKVPGVWLADHPLPLTLPRTHTLTLWMQPTTGDRIKVRCHNLTKPTAPLWLGATLSAVAACLTGCGPLLAATIAFVTQTALMTHCTKRFAHYPRI